MIDVKSEVELIRGLTGLQLTEWGARAQVDGSDGGEEGEVGMMKIYAHHYPL